MPAVPPTVLVVARIFELAVTAVVVTVTAPATRVAVPPVAALPEVTRTGV
jgi:hypothetical protein